MMRFGTMHDAGDVVLAFVQFTDSDQIKKRPALVLFAEYDNVVVAGITSNRKMKGIPLLKSEGAVKDSVIKPNYIFTISDIMIDRLLFKLNKNKRKEVYDALNMRIKKLLN